MARRARWRSGVRDWPGFMAAFHASRSGITEATLSDALRPDLGNPYRWLVAGLPAGNGTVVDVACGSAPLYPLLVGRRYLGVDFSAQELRRASERGRGPLVRGIAEALPVATGAADAVTVSMALQVLDLDQVLPEIARALNPGGLVVATVPAGRLPRGLGQLTLAVRLVLALRRVPGYRNGNVLRHATGLFARSGMRVVSDESLDFPLMVEDERSALAFVDSLYLAGLSARRRRRAAAVMVGRCWLVRVRRLIAERY